MQWSIPRMAYASPLYIAAGQAEAIKLTLAL